MVTKRIRKKKEKEKRKQQFFPWLFVACTEIGRLVNLLEAANDSKEEKFDLGALIKDRSFVERVQMDVDFDDVLNFIHNSYFSRGKDQHHDRTGTN